ncbi:hypothetical protein [Neobacillus sp. 19]|uniref:hypothetical protein n=1 Tax=Neobacillus sp. 19 TaxID=3394458 RepID=UPI003BF747FB
MNEVVKFLENIIEDMNDINWCIVGLTDYKEVTGVEEVYAELPDGSIFDKQDDYYLHQVQHGDDFYSGTIIYPITDNKAVIIHYDC